MRTHMAFVNQLIRTVREAHGLSLDAAARESDFAISTLHNYEQGLHEVPARYLRALGRLTHDVRLIQYMFPELPLVPDPPRKRSAPARRAPSDPPGDPRQSNQELLNALQDLAEVAKINDQIFADGRVTDADAPNLLKQQACGHRVMTILARHARNMDAWREASERKAGR